jgi:hypothetical protein
VELAPASCLSELLGCVVEDGSGRRLGHVFEIRGHWGNDGAPVFDELLVGRHGLMRRLRGPGEDDRGIPWEAVVRIEKGTIGVQA